MAAQYFIEVNQLEQYYLDEIAKFIIKNVPNLSDVPSKPFYRPGKGQPPPSSSSTTTQTTEQKIPPSNSST